VKTQLSSWPGQRRGFLLKGVAEEPLAASSPWSARSFQFLGTRPRQKPCQAPASLTMITSFVSLETSSKSSCALELFFSPLLFALCCIDVFVVVPTFGVRPCPRARCCCFFLLVGRPQSWLLSGFSKINPTKGLCLVFSNDEDVDVAMQQYINTYFQVGIQSPVSVRKN
jgi:hypothetical protein